LLNRQRLTLLSLGIAVAITALGVGAFRVGLAPGLGQILVAGAVLTAPGSFFATWAPQGSYWGMMLVLCVTNVAAWALILYHSILVWQKLRRRAGAA